MLRIHSPLEGPDRTAMRCMSAEHRQQISTALGSGPNFETRGEGDQRDQRDFD
jgi:hypothetical protein